ncbi:NO signaling/Golgi transport ligand-binding domain-containing protein [Pelagophyceae sp. CCMP2097]|nr:NO signaling/Golgi transport ligand-binding domain-containing protein [Pelagophyceae sp. CCMP2097]
MSVSLCVFELLLAESVAVQSAALKEEGADEKTHAKVLAKIEAHGYEVGYRFVERVSEGRALATDHLEAVKFLCKDVWNEVFGKQIDKLQTNHRGVFVLKDYAFRWLARVSSHDDALVSATAARLLQFPAGVLRGALANIGIRATVNAEFSALPGCAFNIRIDATPPPRAPLVDASRQDKPPAE